MTDESNVTTHDQHKSIKFYNNDSFCDTFDKKLRRLLNYGPIIGLGTTVYLECVSLVCIFCRWNPLCSLIGFINISCNLMEFYYIMNSYLSAIFYGPGFATKGWRPIRKVDLHKLQYCHICEGYKPPRAHHCRRCGRCVLKMDHHCAWINCCCGHLNHGKFMHFIISAPIGSLHCCILCIWHMHTIFTKPFYMLMTELASHFSWNMYVLVLVITGLGLSIGVLLAVGGLAFCQLRAIARNETVIERWILEKANHRRKSTDEDPFVFPYDLGCWLNLSQVLTPSGDPINDGYNWPIRRVCDEFDLTCEQIKQKEEKNSKRQEFIVTNPYSGSFFPIYSFGFRVALLRPCFGEPLLKVCVGDHILVTHSRYNWYYGRISSRHGQTENILTSLSQRGWFPKRCVKYLRKDKKFL